MRFFSDRSGISQTREQELCALNNPPESVSRINAFRAITSFIKTAPAIVATLLLPLLLLGFGANAQAQSSANGSTLFHTTYACSGCHGSTPGKPQLNAANSTGILDYAIANNYGGAMGGFSGLSASERADIAAYFQTVLSANLPITATVPYHGSSAAIPLLIDLHMGDTTGVSYSSQTNGTVAAGTSVTYTSPAGTSNMSEATAVFTHTANNCTAGSFTATGTGPGGGTAGRTVTVSVTAPASPDISTSATTAAGSWNNATATPNTTNIPITSTGGPIASIAVTTPLNHGGNLVTNGTTSFTYTPNSTAYFGTETFTYQATGPCGQTSGFVTVTITVAQPKPTSPNTAAGVAYQTATPIVLNGGIANTATSVAVITGPTNGGTSISGTTVTYTPNAGYIGSDSFTYQTSGPAGTSVGTGTVTLTVNAPGAPTITQPINVSVAYNTGSVTTTIPLAGYITGPVSSITLSTPPGLGSAAVSLPTSMNYTPVANDTTLTGTTFQFTATAPGGATSGAATVNVSITPPGAPTLQNHPVSICPNSGPTVIDVAGDITGPYSTVSVTNPGSLGGSGVVAGTQVTYTLPANTAGTDTLAYKVTAPGGANSTANIVVTLPLTSAAATVGVPFNTPTVIPLTATGTSTSGTACPTAIEIVTAPTKGTLSTPVAGVYSLTYTPGATYTGSDSFVYRVKGTGSAYSSNSTISITVNPQTPGAGNTTMTVPLNTATTLDLAPFITGSGITGISIASNPSHGAVSINGTKVTFTPVNNYFGADSFTYLAYGNAAAPNNVSPTAGTVTVNVIGRPDPTKDPSVTGLITSQGETARRFSRAQISNFQSRMESLHRRVDTPEADAPGGSANSSFNEPRSTTPAEIAAKGYARDNNAPVPQTVNRQPSGSAYRPAASLAGDPAAGLMPAQPTNASAALATVTSALSGGAKPSDPAALLGKAVGIAATAAQSSTLNLAASSGDGSTSQIGDIDIWAGGSVRYGSRDAGSTTGSTFSSDGVSFGADMRVSDQLAVGVGFGYARDRSDIGTDGTLSNSRSSTIAVYGSYQPAPNFFIDGLLGYGNLSYDTDRFVTPISQFAHGKRNGDFLFASLAAGYEFRTTGLLLSPYGRLDLASHRLNDVTETGAGLYALHYYSQRIPSVQAALGLRLESAHETGFGYVLPRLRVEYQHDFKGEQAATISYADQIGGTVYTVPAVASNRNSVVLGVGSDFVFGGGLRLALDYQMQRASLTDNSQAIFFKLVKDLDGRTPKIPTYALGSRGFGINLDGGITYDDNVTRSSASATRLFDTIYSFNASRPFTISLADNWRIGLNVFAGADKFKTYTGLDRIFGGGEAALQYRESGEFGSPIYSLFANFAADEYQSELRDGKRLSLGVSMRKAFTDRISIYAALAKNARYARSDVFNTRDYSARMNVDYSITPESTLYLTGEYRRGDIVSTGEHTLTNINVARVFSRDDAFTRQGLYAYRADGRTVLLTLGYNLPLSTHDSLDFSVRRVFSEASLDSNTGAGKPRYFANQFSIIYLTSF